MLFPHGSPEGDRLQAVLWIGVGLAFAWLLSLLSPILAPFLLAGILAYICNPIADRLSRLRLPRVVAVAVVLLLMAGLLVALLLIVVPLLHDEVMLLAARLPELAALANERLLPWLQQHYGINLRLDAETLRAFAAENAGSVQAMAQKLLESLKIGGLVVVGLIANLLLVPVVMFYLLLDWHDLRERAVKFVPRPWHDKVTSLAADIDAVLSEFLRGQLSVMLILAGYYSLGLWIAGISSALPVGILTGLLIFIPYIGFAAGLLLALLVALLPYEGFGPVAGVLVVYGIGQVLESVLLTPFLVGNRVGLHPLAVIFALMAFGQLFGFFGVLLALPASAALLVGLRELRHHYFASRFYQGRP